MDSRHRSGNCSGRWRRALCRLVGRQAPPLWWHTSEALSRAVAATGLEGLRFELIAVGVESGMLTLTFGSLQPVPDQLRRETALALRAVVGQTMPAVASSVRSIKAEVGDRALYQLILGDGVPMPELTLHCGAVHAGPLRVTSEEADGRWCVTVSPFASPRDHFSYSRQTETQDRIFRLLIPAFAPLTYKALTLGG